MIALIIFLVVVIGGFIGLLYFNVVEYGKSDLDYTENNMLYNLKTCRENTNRIIKEEKKEKEEEKEEEKED